ncbi:MAG: tRNA (guanine-N2)-dimethyltransferase, partial [Candidatus Aminicenantes bacterium]|nr:tRNA (guanine-N2)-dimethyltransferase [Candidatus Aminicenantes bacterium]
LNLSVSVGIILYEAYRQRYEKGFYSASRLSQEEFNRWLKLWLSNPKDRKTFLQEK